MLSRFTYCAHELHLDARVLQPLAIFGSDSHGSSHTLAIEVEGRLFPPVLVELHVYRLPVVGVLENNVDVQRRAEREERHVGGDSSCSEPTAPANQAHRWCKGEFRLDARVVLGNSLAVWGWSRHWLQHGPNLHVIRRKGTPPVYGRRPDRDEVVASMHGTRFSAPRAKM